MFLPHKQSQDKEVKYKRPRRPISLPVDFPNIDSPRFRDGDKLRWIAEDNKTDCGIVLGRFYNYAPHRRCWMWCYLIWLDKNSPSAAWIVADLAWEEDLEDLEQD
jgi:hypothetical protein